MVSHGKSYPTVLDKMMQDQDSERSARVPQAFLKMKKFDLAALQRAVSEKSQIVAKNRLQRTALKGALGGSLQHASPNEEGP